MIFVTLGSQKFQFNRLLKKLDELIQENKISEEVFAQIGYSDYKPKNYKYEEFIDREEFKTWMKKASLVITHGGTGAIITALKNNKKVIAIPRLNKYREHVDNHQIQIIDEFKELNLIEPIYDIENLYKAINDVRIKRYDGYYSNTDSIIKSIEEYIEIVEEEKKN